MEDYLWMQFNGDDGANTETDDENFKRQRL